MRKMVAIIIMVICLVSAYQTDLLCSIYDIPTTIKSPEALVNWLHSEFTYIFKIPDYKQTLEETISRRTGDCEDFAALCQEVLKGLGISSDIVVIKFRQIDIMHAVCIFKEKNAYSFIASREMVRTNGRSIREAITENFPDWDRMTFMTADGRFVRSVDRGYAEGARTSALSIASMYGNMLSPENRDIGIIKFMIESRLSSLVKSGMSFSATTLATIFKGVVEYHVKFLFEKIELTTGGFRVPCVAEDTIGTRTYYALFSIRSGWEGFIVAVYPENDWKRVNQFNAVVPHPIR